MLPKLQVAVWDMPRVIFIAHTTASGPTANPRRCHVRSPPAVVAAAGYPVWRQERRDDGGPYNTVHTVLELHQYETGPSRMIQVHAACDKPQPSQNTLWRLPYHLIVCTEWRHV